MDFKKDAQFKEQFPDCPRPLPGKLSEEMLYDERNKRQIEEIKNQLVTVKLLINADPFSDNKPCEETQKAVDVLCQLFKPTPGEVIRSGLHFPLAIMREIYETYNEIYKMGNSLENRLPFFSLEIIKPALDALSIVDGQCCQYGLDDLDMIKGPNRRCHPSYTHPLGRPLSLELVNSEAKPRRSHIIDPCDGDVFFKSSSPDQVECFDRIGNFVLKTSWRDSQLLALEEFFGKLMENKSKSLWANYATTHRKVSTLSNGK